MIAIAKLVGIGAAVLLLFGLLVAPRAEAQATPDSFALELIGARVFAADGADVGEVSAVTIGPDGQVAEVRMTTDRALGFGERVVVLPRGTFMALRGAVVLDRSWFALPAPPQLH
jgi:ribosomal 30S subunit maturation factor RimM